MKKKKFLLSKTSAEQKHIIYIYVMITRQKKNKNKNSANLIH